MILFAEFNMAPFKTELNSTDLIRSYLPRASIVGESAGRLALICLPHSGVWSNVCLSSVLFPFILFLGGAGVFGKPTDNIIKYWRGIGATVKTTNCVTNKGRVGGGGVKKTFSWGVGVHHMTCSVLFDSAGCITCIFRMFNEWASS